MLIANLWIQNDHFVCVIARSEATAKWNTHRISRSEQWDMMPCLQHFIAMNWSDGNVFLPRKARIFSSYQRAAWYHIFGVVARWAFNFSRAFGIYIRPNNNWQLKWSYNKRNKLLLQWNKSYVTHHHHHSSTMESCFGSFLFIYIPFFSRKQMRVEKTTDFPTEP